MEDEEVTMLADAFNIKGNSRLNCQITLLEKLHELEIELAPEAQINCKCSIFAVDFL